MSLMTTQQKTHTMKTIAELLQRGQMLMIDGRIYKVGVTIQTSVGVTVGVVTMTDEGKKFETLKFPLGTEILAY